MAASFFQDYGKDARSIRTAWGARHGSWRVPAEYISGDCREHRGEDWQTNAHALWRIEPMMQASSEGTYAVGVSAA